MVFRSKVNMLLLIAIFLAVSIIGTIPWLSVYKDASIAMMVALCVLFIMSACFILWYGTSLRYIFREDHLIIKGGPFKRKIPYQSITKVSPTIASFTGYRISPSDKGVELFLASTSLKRVKLLPEDKIEFITQLRKRCPDAQIQDFE